jgi:hypothetical protein
MILVAATHVFKYSFSHNHDHGDMDGLGTEL